MKRSGNNSPSIIEAALKSTYTYIPPVVIQMYKNHKLNLLTRGLYFHNFKAGV